MRAYLITTGTVFGLITLAHVARFFVEGTHLMKEPVFVLLTILAAALCFWAFRLLWRSTRPWGGRSFLESAGGEPIPAPGTPPPAAGEDACVT